MARKAGSTNPNPTDPELERKSPGRKAKLVMITGLSGSGKITALKVFEDMGYYCVDNLPAELIPSFAQLIEDTRDNKNAAIVVDIREGSRLEQLPKIIGDLKKRLDVTLIYLDTSDKVLVRRFSETRRPHPLGAAASVTEFDHQRAPPAGADPQHRRPGDRHFEVQRARTARPSG